MSIRGFVYLYIVALILFVIACVTKIIINNLIFVMHKKVLKTDVVSKAAITVVACLSEFLVALIVWLIVVFYYSGELSFSVLHSIASPMNYRLIGILISTVFIFCYDYFFLLPFMQVSKKHKLLLALLFTILNAPYFALIPVGNIVYSLNLY